MYSEAVLNAVIVFLFLCFSDNVRVTFNQYFNSFAISKMFLLQQNVVCGPYHLIKMEQPHEERKIFKI